MKNKDLYSPEEYYKIPVITGCEQCTKEWDDGRCCIKCHEEFDASLVEVGATVVKF